MTSRILLLLLQKQEQNNESEVWIAEAESDCLFFCPLGMKQLGRRTYIHTVHFLYIISLFKYIKMALHLASKLQKKSLLHSVDAV